MKTPIPIALLFGFRLSGGRPRRNRAFLRGGGDVPKSTSSRTGRGSKPDPPEPRRDFLRHPNVQIQLQSQGENAAFNQILLRAPGVAQDSFGQLHVRGEHANLQYRINDVLLPEGITGFGEELDTRFVDRVSLIDGALPAQYGFKTAGIVDIHTKSGVFEPGGDVSFYGGSFDTYRPSIEYGGSSGKLDYYFTGELFPECSRNREPHVVDKGDPR